MAVDPPSGQLKGQSTTVWVENDALMIKYSVWAYGFLGTKQVPVQNIKAFTWREPGSVMAGFLEIAILGEPTPSPLANINVQRQNRLQYDRPARDGFAQLRDWIAERIGDRAEGSDTPSVAEQLTKLTDLLDRGFLTAEEFAVEKAKVLAR